MTKRQQSAVSEFRRLSLRWATGRASFHQMRRCMALSRRLKAERKAAL